MAAGAAGSSQPEAALDKRGRKFNVRVNGTLFSVIWPSRKKRG
jgi:hypothetical protein